MAQELAIGIDIGGTKIAFALINREGHVLHEHRISTQPGDGTHTTLDRIAEGLRLMMGESGSNIIGVGIGCPGPVDPQNGISLNAVNLGWKNVHLRKELQQRTSADLPVYLLRDVDAVAIGEMYFGAARGCQDFLYVGVGTGLGLSAIIGGKPLIGANFSAMEMGHISVVRDGRQCNCGLRGCTETYASGVGFLLGYEEHAPVFPQTILKGKVTTQDILSAYHSGDALAKKIVDEGCEKLADLMVYCVCMANSTLVVLGGGLGLALVDEFMQAMEHTIQQRTLGFIQKNLAFTKSEITSTALGAAALVWHYGG